MTLQQPPVARTQMLIQRPIAEVFQAFIDPAITRKFWFTRGSDKLEPGKEVEWEWAMYGFTAKVEVKDVEPTTRIAIEWGDPPRPVEWSFEPRGVNATMVVITNTGFGTDDDAVAAAIDAMGGFSFVLAGLKAWLEHGVELNLVRDHHPDGHIKLESAT